MYQETHLVGLRDHKSVFTVKAIEKHKVIPGLPLYHKPNQETTDECHILQAAF